MQTCTDVPQICEDSLEDHDLWMKLYPQLLPKAQRWVYNSGVPVWRGQEYDVAWDIVQTAIERTFVYIRKARQQDIPVHFPEHLAVVVAKNYYRDLKRHEQRLQHFPSDETVLCGRFTLNNLVDPAEEASEQLHEEEVLRHSARHIARFSQKLRLAILVDLANRMHFDADPTVLQQAFLAAGIRLQEYQRPQSVDPGERNRQSALRHLAYKRVTQLVCAQQRWETREMRGDQLTL